MSTSIFKHLFLITIILILSKISLSAPAGTVTLTTPLDSSTNLTLPIPLVWEAPTNTDFYLYIVQLSMDASFQTMLINENTTSTTYTITRSLTPSKKYYWRIIAQKKLSLTEPTLSYYISDPWSFYTASSVTPPTIALPAVPVLVAPTNTLTNVPLAPKLTWKSALRAASYSVQVSVDARFVTSAIKIDQQNITNTYYEPGYVAGSTEAVLKAGVRYYWRVRAVNDGGNSGWSNYYSFLTTNSTQITPPPTAVNFITPVNGLTYNIDSTTNVIASWSASTKATSYTIQISTDSTFTTLKKTATTTLTNYSIDITEFEASKFYWRVLATNSSGSTPSATQFFTVMPKFLISPLNGEVIEAENGAATLVFSWDKMHYVADLNYLTCKSINDYIVYLEYANNIDFKNLTSTKLNPGTTTTSISKSSFIPIGTTYYWRVRLESTLPEPPTPTINFNNYSEKRSFKIISKQVATLVPTAPILDKPIDNSVITLDTTLNADAPIAFNWTPYQTGVTYSLAIAKDNTFTPAVEYTSPVMTTLSTSIAKTLLAAGDHYWRVTATNSIGSTKSEIRKFTIKKDITTTVLNSTIISLNSPVTGTITSASAIGLTWKEINNPTLYGDLQYTLQISKNINVTSPILDTQITSPKTGGLIEYQTGSDYGTTKAILQPKTTYYWRVKLTDNATGQSTNWSSVWSFTTEDTKIISAPAVPTLLSPINNATGTGLSPSFYWNAVDKADYYHYQLSTSNAFGLGTILYDLDQIKVLNLSLPSTVSLNLNTAYYWRLQAANIVGVSAYISSKFTTRDTTEAPTLLTPGNSSTTGNDSIVFSWNAVTGATSYNFELSSTSNFTNILYSKNNLAATEITITNADVTLVKSSRYYWRVTGKSAGGTGHVSSTWSFTVQTDYLPANGAINLAIIPTLSWPIPAAPINALISYQIQVSPNSTFSYITFSKTGQSANNIIVAGAGNTAILLNSTTYYWRIRPVINGVNNNWSFPYYFTTIASTDLTPGKPGYSTPADKIVNVNAENGLTFTWTAGSNATTYTLQVASDANFATIVINTSGISGLSYPLTTAQCGLLLPNTAYYWRVRSVNKTGSSAWTAKSDGTYNMFTTKPLSVVTLTRPVLISPLDLVTQAIGNVTFSYNPVAGATQYNLVIANASDFNINSIISDTTTTGATLSANYAFTKAGNYYWRVKAIRDLYPTDGIIDAESDFSFYRNIIIQ